MRTQSCWRLPQDMHFLLHCLRGCGSLPPILQNVDRVFKNLSLCTDFAPQPRSNDCSPPLPHTHTHTHTHSLSLSPLIVTIFTCIEMFLTVFVVSGGTHLHVHPSVCEHLPGLSAYVPYREHSAGQGNVMYLWQTQASRKPNENQTKNQKTKPKNNKQNKNNKNTQQKQKNT